MRSETKKYLYLGIWLIAGGLFGFLLSEIAELFLLVNNESLENKFEIYGLFIIVFTGAAAFIGPVAYRKIYIEGLRGKKYIVKK